MSLYEPTFGSDIRSLGTLVIYTKVANKAKMMFEEYGLTWPYTDKKIADAKEKCVSAGKHWPFEDTTSFPHRISLASLLK